ncbi:MAG: aminotransferase class IV [Reichenbachiella sp.]
MCQYIESVCYLEGEPQLLSLHQERMDRTAKKVFSNGANFNLSLLLPVIPDLDKHKCRVVYDKDGVSVEYVKYQTPQIRSLKIVESSSIAYEFKSVDRDHLAVLYDQREEQDDVIIIKDGWVTDSFFSNLALFDGQKWVTPSTPLLRGVRRQYLLKTGSVIEERVRAEDLQRFQQISLINSMNNLGDIVVDIQQVV